MISAISENYFGAEVDNRLATALEEHEKFLDVLEKVDIYLESQKKTEKEKRAEQAEEQAKKARKKKMDDLSMMISQMRTRVNMGDESAQGQLSLLQSELLLMQLFG